MVVCRHLDGWEHNSFLITVIETGHNNHLRIQDQGNGFVKHFNARLGRHSCLEWPLVMFHNAGNSYK